MDLISRTQSVIDQLTRYGNAVFTEELADLLEEIAEINDDMNHARNPQESIDRAKAILDSISMKKWTLD